MSTTLLTIDEVIDALGGSSAVARLCGYRWPSPVTNWRQRKTMPASQYLVMIAALEKAGKTAPASLWGIRDGEVAA